MKKTLKILGNVLFYAAVLFVLSFAVMSIVSKKNNGVAKVAGYAPVVVLTDSMVGENPDSFNPGDIIFIKTVKDYSSLNIGDVISFYDKSNGKIIVNSHRITDIKTLQDGRILFETQGDKYDQPDALLKETTDIIGVYTGKLEKVGNAILWMQSSIGFFIIVVLPSLGFLLYELIRFLKILMEEKLLKQQEEESDEIKRLKEELERLKNANQKEE